MKNIVLIGMPGCGKTTVGKLLAKALDIGFIDCDSFIEKKQQLSVSEIFKEKGESFFRDLETETLRDLSAVHGNIIATGGGCVERPVNITLLQKLGTVVFINRPLEHILGDVDTAKRPLLAGGKNKLFELYKRRLPLYKEACDIEVENSLQPERLVEKIINEVNIKNG